MLAYPMFWLSMTQGVSFALPNKSSGAGGTGSCHTAGRVWGTARGHGLVAVVSCHFMFRKGSWREWVQH